MLSVVRDHFYSEAPISGIKFTANPTYEWSFQSNGILIMNDSLQTLSWSFNGLEVDGTIKPQDKWISLDIKRETRIWLKTSKVVAGGSKARVIVWRGEG